MNEAFDSLCGSGAQYFLSSLDSNQNLPIDFSIPMQSPYAPGASTILPYSAPLMQAAVNANSAPSPKVIKAETNVKKNNAAETNTRKRKRAVDPTTEKRRQKNRQAAKMFRKRQKQHIEDLEAKVTMLESANGELSTRVNNLTLENKIVREQLDYMRGFVTQAFQCAFPAEKLAAFHKQIGVEGLKSPQDKLGVQGASKSIQEFMPPGGLNVPL
eukprot:TRINITY_DN5893_c0_g1_i1.p1 TRINITY_DN5893_c0_g1~~TRINITY_DN5893_c0_g1_i1.p1  ORF type:complete len:233 (-),score=50.52 TRINITY_DN5893_c0_g1_i1:100-741(-)